jgi:hypothetical protein
MAIYPDAAGNGSRRLAAAMHVKGPVMTILEMVLVGEFLGVF